MSTDNICETARHFDMPADCTNVRHHRCEKCDRCYTCEEERQRKELHEATAGG